MRHSTEVCQRVSVLVVEDDPDTAASTADLLGRWGFRAAVAGTCRDALAAADRDPPDAVLLDLRLPDGDGCRVAERLRATAAARRPLVVAVTGCGRDRDVRRAEAAGVDLHLTKPVAPADLLAVLGRFARLLASDPGPAQAGVGAAT